MHKWKLHEAKNKLSSLIDIAMHGNAQCITKRGEDAVVVIGINEYKKLKKQQISLKDFLMSGIKFDDLDIERVRGKARKVEL
jgi:prevent-host-death family protein